MKDGRLQEDTLRYSAGITLCARGFWKGIAIQSTRITLKTMRFDIGLSFIESTRFDLVKSRGFVHYTLALTIAESMGSQWAYRLATVVVLCDYKGCPRKYPEKCWTLTALNSKY